MRKLLLTLTLLLGGIGTTSLVYSQAGAYAFTASSGTFTAVTGGTDVDAIEADFAISASLPIGFSFDFDGVTYTQFKATSDGYLTFGTATGTVGGNNLDFVAATSRPLVAPLWDDLDGRAEDPAGNLISEAKYVLTGTAPNRVLTFEWLNWEWRWNSTDPVISFQVKLYETSNVVEFIYQQEVGAVATGSASIGITGLSSFISLDGTGAAPNASNTAETANLSTKPANGQIYTFTPPSCPAPGGLAANNITSSGAELDWAATTVADYQVEYGTTGFTLGSGTNTGLLVDSLVVVGLTANTSYEFYVRTICAVGDTSGWAGPFSFTTLCGNFVPNYLENFSTYVPDCWSEAAGVLGATNTTFSSTTSSFWIQDGFGNVGTTGSARMEIFSTGRDEWLISPTIDLGTGATPYQLQYDVALTTWNNTNADVLGTDDTLAVVISTDNGVTWSQSNIIQLYVTGSEPSATGDFTVIPLTGYTGLVKFGFYAASSVSGGDVNVYIDNFEVRDVPNCPQPTMVAVDSVTSTDAYISWAVGATNTIIEYGLAGFTQGAGTTLNVNGGTATITGLTGITGYEFYIRDSCNAIDLSPWTGPVSFTTDCPIYVPTYTENFTTYLPSCWDEFQGVLGATSTTITTVGTSNWGSSNFGNVGSNSSAYMNLWSTGRDEWLVSPSIDLGTGATGYQVAFDIALTGFSNTNATTLGSDDTIAIVISTDNGVTWSQTNILQTWLDGTEPSNTGDYIAIDLSAYTGVVKFGFYTASSVSNADNDIFIDNFTVEPIPSCPQPLDLTTSNLTQTSVDVSWTLGAANSFVEYGTSGFTQGTGTIVPATGGTASITGLMADTNYDFYVMDSCGVGDVSTWNGPGSFFTGYCTPAPSTVDGSGITNVTLGTINNTTGAETGNYGDYSAQIADVIQGAPAQAFAIEFSTGFTYGTKIWVDWNNDLSFDTSEEVYFGLSTNINPTVLSGTFAIPSSVATGNYRLRIGGTDDNNGPSDACYTGFWGSFEDYTINVIAPCVVNVADVQVACDTYTWIDGMTYTANNTTAVDTVISNVAGVCDTIYSLDLTINSSSTGTDVQTACGAYTWIDGTTYTADNNSATFTLTNAAGCDSVVTLDLTINALGMGTDVQTACDSYTWIDGNTYTTSNNTAMFTIAGGAANGCDSIVTLDLTINNSNSGVDVVNACGSYTWIDGNTYTNSTSTPTFTDVNAAGCDSVITLLLTINQASSSVATITACESYTWIDGVTYTASNNSTTYTIPNSNGCDSIITLDLTINDAVTNTITATECDSYTSGAGNTYTTTGVYTEVLVAANGCDSIVTLDLTITNPNATVTQISGVYLSSNQPGATYQWLDCDNGNAPIAGETDQLFVAEDNGNYACEVTFQNCTVTSTCITVNNVGIEDASAIFANIFPNPATDQITITLSDFNNTQFELMDMQGKIVMAPTNIVSGQTIDVSDLRSGIYFVRLTSDDSTMIKRVVKH